MIRGMLIGAGQRGMGAYASYALKHPGDFKIVAVAEPDIARRKEAQCIHQIADDHAFTCWELMLEKGIEADCVLVCNQDQFHTAPVLAALQAGYHVLCEKPMSPDPAECIRMGEFAREYGKTITVCHVLRYSPFFTAVKDLIEKGTIGEIVTIQQIECVGYWHQAHSFVRGNWRNSDISSPMILAKSCHDMDILMWLTGERCLSVSSFGSCKHFKEQNAPAGSADYCKQGCKVTSECPFFCDKIYLGEEAWYSPVIRKVVSQEATNESVAKALEQGPYGRCVYRCDNNVVDHQIVNLQMTNDVTISFTMSGFTSEVSRVINIMGTKGQITGDMNRSTIEVTDFLTENTTSINIKGNGSGHNGSDDAFMRAFLRTVETNGAFSLSSAEASVDSHLVALAAEESRLLGKTLDFGAYKEGIV